MAGKKGKKSNAGAPPKLRTKRQRERFLRVLYDNLGNVSATLRQCKIHKSTLGRERTAHPEFDEAVREAKEAAIDEMVAKGAKLARDGDGAMIRFFLPRLRPEEFAETQRMQHVGEIDVKHTVQITVIEDPDWYGRKTIVDQTPASIAPPDPDLIVEGTVQSSSVRPALGQNGSGSNGHSAGPWPYEGDVPGSD